MGKRVIALQVKKQLQWVVTGLLHYFQQISISYSSDPALFKVEFIKDPSYKMAIPVMTAE